MNRAPLLFRECGRPSLANTVQRCPVPTPHPRSYLPGLLVLSAVALFSGMGLVAYLKPVPIADRVAQIEARADVDWRAHALQRQLVDEWRAMYAEWRVRVAPSLVPTPSTAPAPAPRYQRTGRTERGIASRMCRANDRWCGSGSKCKLAPLSGGGPAASRRIVPTDHVVAHRSIPCGTVIEVCNPKTELCTFAKVGTSGPFGACLREGEQSLPGAKVYEKKGCSWVVKIRATDPGVWRGVLDMTDSVRVAIGHSGWGPVVVHRVREQP